MNVRRVGLSLVALTLGTLVFSGVAYAGIKKLSPATAQGMWELLQNPEEADPVPLWDTPAEVQNRIICGSLNGFYECWGESMEVCPTSIPFTSSDDGTTQLCTLTCTPSTPVDGKCDCLIDKCY